MFSWPGHVHIPARILQGGLCIINKYIFIITLQNKCNICTGDMERILPTTYQNGHIPSGALSDETHDRLDSRNPSAIIRKEGDRIIVLLGKGHFLGDAPMYPARGHSPFDRIPARRRSDSGSVMVAMAMCHGTPGIS